MLVFLYSFAKLSIHLELHYQIFTQKCHCQREVLCVKMWDIHILSSNIIICFNCDLSIIANKHIPYDIHCDLLFTYIFFIQMKLVSWNLESKYYEQWSFYHYFYTRDIDTSYLGVIKEACTEVYTRVENSYNLRHSRFFIWHLISFLLYFSKVLFNWFFGKLYLFWNEQWWSVHTRIISQSDCRILMHEE